MARLPIPGNDDNVWGSILNDFLSIAHNNDGTLQTSAISGAGGELIANKGQPSGYAGLNSSSLVPLAQLGSGTASGSNFLRGDGTWAAPASGSSTLVGDSDVNISSPTNNQVLTYNSSSGKWVNQNVPSAPVSSVFGRTGAISAQAGDYTATQVGALPVTDDLSAIANTNATAASVPMNNNKITGLANGSSATDAAAFGQIPTAGTGLTNSAGNWSVTYGTTAGTAAQGNDSRITNALQIGATAGNDLSGTYPNPTVAKLNGISAPSSAPIGSGQVLTTTSTSTTAWQTPQSNSHAVVTKTSNYTATTGDEVILADATSVSSTLTVTLPTAAGNTNMYDIKKVDSSSHTVTVATTASQTIDGGTTAIIKVQYASISLVSNGSNWFII